MIVGIVFVICLFVLFLRYVWWQTIDPSIKNMFPPLHISSMFDSEEVKKRISRSNCPEEPTKRRYLVTGGSGVLGQEFIRLLCDNGVEQENIRVLDTNKGEFSGVEYFIGDIRDEQLVKLCVKGVNVVVHTCGIVDPSGKRDDLMYSVHVEGTSNVVSACKEEDSVVMLIHVSSTGAIEGYNCVGDEDSIPYPKVFVDKYCATKNLAEQIVLSSHGECGLSVAALRFHTIYGPLAYSSELNYLFRKMMVVFGKGGGKQTPIYVKNAAHSLWCVASCKLNDIAKTLGSAFFVTDGIVLTIGEMCSEFHKFLGERPPRYIPEWVGWIVAFVGSSLGVFGIYHPGLLTINTMQHVCSDRVLSDNKARKILKYSPLYTFEEGMKETALYYKERE